MRNYRLSLIPQCARALSSVVLLALIATPAAATAPPLLVFAAHRPKCSFRPTSDG